jgi:sugar phosphate permease
MRPKIFYGWTVAAVVFCAFMISVGPRQSFSMFLLALLEEFGGSRSRIAGVFSVHIILYGLSGWGLGVLVDRVGPRKVLIGSTMVWAATLLICSQVREFWQL